MSKACPGSLCSALLLTAALGFLAGCPGEVPEPGSGAPAGSASTEPGGGGDPYTNLELHTVEDGEKPTVAYVTNGIASFWLVAEVGANVAAEEFNVNLEVRMPPDGAVDQKRMLEELLAADVDGIAVSPIDPDNQNSLLNECAEATNLITHDSDAPHSNRICYVGTSNYVAGRKCGMLVKQAMPEGGSLMIFVGRLEQANARDRRQGLIDELLDRDDNPQRFDAPGDEIVGEKYTILDTRTDGFDFGKAKALAEDAITAHPDLGCMVGLFAYNPPIILEALRGADKLNEIHVVGFDEDERTLQAIKDGTCHGTIVQNPYQYGYTSVRILAGLARGDRSVLPEGGFIDFPVRSITSEKVDEFWEEFKALMAQNPAQ